MSGWMQLGIVVAIFVAAAALLVWAFRLEERQIAREEEERYWG